MVEGRGPGIPDPSNITNSVRSVLVFRYQKRSSEIHTGRMFPCWTRGAVLYGMNFSACDNPQP